MKKLFGTIAIILLSTFSCEKRQSGFLIEASVKQVSNGTIFYLKSWRRNSLIDSVFVMDGKFTLKGMLSRPEKLFLYANDSLTNEFIYTNLIIGNEHVTLHASKEDFPWNVDVNGSIHQDIAEKFNQVEYQKQKIRQKLEKNFEKLPGQERDEQKLSETLKRVADSLDNLKIELLKENFNSYASLINFVYYKNQIPQEELELLYQKLSPDLKKSIYGKAIEMQLNYPPANIGDHYYDYIAINQCGDTIALSGIEKYILLHFSHAACFYSQKSIPELKRLYDRYKDRLEIVKISEDLDRGAWEKSILRDSITWTNLWDGKGEYSDAVVKYGVVGAPNYVLISPENIIVEKWFGYEDGIIEEKLEKHLGAN